MCCSTIDKMIMITNKVVNDPPISSSISWKPSRNNKEVTLLYILSCLHTIYPLMWWGWKNPKNWFWYIYESNSQFFFKISKDRVYDYQLFLSWKLLIFYIFDITKTNSLLILILPSFNPISIATILITMDILWCQLLLKLNIRFFLPLSIS
jgi:hypothetical protein